MIISGSPSNNIAEVNAASDALRVEPYGFDGNPLAAQQFTVPANPYGLLMNALNDQMLVGVRADRFGSLASALHQCLFHDSFEGTTIHANRWLITNTTMAATQASAAGVVFNSGSITTITTGYMLQSARRFQKTQRGLLQAKFRARLIRQNNSVMELGFGDAATFNGANTTGAYWQCTASGAVVPVLTFNGVDVTGTNVSASLNASNFYTFDIMIDDDEVIYMIQNTEDSSVVARQSLKLPAAGVRLWSSTQLALQARLYNTGSAPATAPQLILSDAYVGILDSNQNRDLPLIQSSIERGMTSHPFTGAQLAQWANSAAPANATLSNTAAGYTTLGGLFSFVAVAGAATDYALFGFQVPAPANLVVTGIDIDTWNTGAAVATTPTLLAWGLGVGSTAVSLATATVMRVGLGSQVLPVGTAVGGQADRRISKQFRTPLVVPSGRFLHLILRMPVGTATASQVIQGMANIEGFFE